MKRKFFTFTMILVVYYLMAANAWAANSHGYIQKMNNPSDHGHSAMGYITGLTQDEKFTLLREEIDFPSVTNARFQLTYNL